MENIKKLKEIREFLKEKNDYWWNEERKDLDLKYYVPTDIMCDCLADYERGLTEDEYKRDPRHPDAVFGRRVFQG